MRVQRFFGSAAMMCGQHRNLRSDVEAVFGPKHWAEFTAVHGKAWEWERSMFHATSGGLLARIRHASPRVPRPEACAAALRTHLNSLCHFEEKGAWPQTHNPATTLDNTATPKWLENKNAGTWVFSGAHSPRMVRPVVHGKVWHALEAALKMQTDKMSSAPNSVSFHGLLIKGHPGIGKTYFLDTLLSWSLFKYEEVPVLVISSGMMTLFTNVGGAGRRRYKADRLHQDPKESLIGLGIPPQAQILVLHDIKLLENLSFDSGPVSALRTEFNITCVLASSPDGKNWVSFRAEVPRHYNELLSKEVAGYYKEILLPTLSFDETSEFLKKVEPNITDQTIVDRFYKVGGVPRHLLSGRVEFEKRRQKEVATTVKFDPHLSGTDAVTNAIVQMIPNADGSFHFGFVSHHACRVWLGSQSPATKAKLLEQLKASRTGSATRAALGLFFEKWFLSALVASSSLSWRRLDRTPGTLNNMTSWPVPKPIVRVEFNDATCIEAGKLPLLFEPVSDQFPVVDAVLVGPKDQSPPEVTLFQVTVAAKHPPKNDKTKHLLKALAKNGLTATRLVWVVDSSSALNEWQELDSGTLAAYSKIPQYLCRWDDNMCWVQLEGSGNDVVAFPCAPGATENEILSLVKKYVDPTAREFTNFTTSVRSELEPLIFRR